MVPLKKKSELIPLLNVLKSLKSTDRVIILAHLDDNTRDDLYLTIESVLQSDKVPFEARIKLQKKLSPHKEQLRHIVDKSVSKQVKKKKLNQLGGNPLKLILNSALPLMLGQFPLNKQ